MDKVIIDLFVNHAAEIVIALLAIFKTGVIDFFKARADEAKARMGKENYGHLQNIAIDAVKFVEQVYTELHGQEKFEKAAHQVFEQGQRQLGYEVPKDTVKMLVEAAVKTLKEVQNGTTDILTEKAE